MTVAQKVPFELVPIDGPIGGFPDAHSTAAALAEAIAAIPGLDRTKLLALRRMGVGHPRRRRHAADHRRAPRHHRPVLGRRPDRPPRRRLASKSLNASKAAAIRSPSAPAHRPSSAGPPATSPSRATIRKSAWPTCAPSCPRCKKPKPQRSRQRPELRLASAFPSSSAPPAS